MLLNLIITIIVGFILLILYVIKGIFDCISTMDKTIRKLKEINDLLHDRLLRLEIISVVDQEEAKKNTTKNE